MLECRAVDVSGVFLLRAKLFIGGLREIAAA
jgi:hypothetical protein